MNGSPELLIYCRGNPFSNGMIILTIEDGIAKNFTPLVYISADIPLSKNAVHDSVMGCQPTGFATEHMRDYLSSIAIKIQEIVIASSSLFALEKGPGIFTGINSAIWRAIWRRKRCPTMLVHTTTIQ